MPLRWHDVAAILTSLLLAQPGAGKNRADSSRSAANKSKSERPNPYRRDQLVDHIIQAVNDFRIHSGVGVIPNTNGRILRDLLNPKVEAHLVRMQGKSRDRQLLAESTLFHYTLQVALVLDQRGKPKVLDKGVKRLIDVVTPKLKLSSTGDLSQEELDFVAEQVRTVYIKKIGAWIFDKNSEDTVQTTVMTLSEMEKALARSLELKLLLGRTDPRRLDRLLVIEQRVMASFGEKVGELSRREDALLYTVLTSQLAEYFSEHQDLLDANVSLDIGRIADQLISALHKSSAGDEPE